MESMFRLDGKVALITGASYGIGFAIAKAFAKAGATIVFNDIKQELVDKGLASYESEGIKAHGYVCDVTDEDAVNALVATVEKEIGVIDILVNNAGIIKRIPMHEMSAKELKKHKIESLPNRLDIALWFLEKNQIVKDALGEHILNEFLSTKKKECELYSLQVSQWEIDRYLDAH